MIIEHALNNDASRKVISDALDIDKSSIYKEIKDHAFFKSFSHQWVSTKGNYNCIYIQNYGYNSLCTETCAKCELIPCNTKDSSSGVCNGYKLKFSRMLIEKR